MNEEKEFQMPPNKESKKRLIVPPEDGWRPQRYYYVYASFRPTNPMHKFIFYSGFLDEKGNPCGYNGILCTSIDGKPEISELFYLEVIGEMGVLKK